MKWKTAEFLIWRLCPSVSLWPSMSSSFIVQRIFIKMQEIQTTGLKRWAIFLTYLFIFILICINMEVKNSRIQSSDMSSNNRKLVDQCRETEKFWNAHSLRKKNNKKKWRYKLLWLPSSFVWKASGTYIYWLARWTYKNYIVIVLLDEVTWYIYWIFLKTDRKTYCLWFAAPGAA